MSIFPGLVRDIDRLIFDHLDIVSQVMFGFTCKKALKLLPPHPASFIFEAPVGKLRSDGSLKYADITDDRVEDACRYFESLGYYDNVKGNKLHMRAGDNFYIVILDWLESKKFPQYKLMMNIFHIY